MAWFRYRQRYSSGKAGWQYMEFGVEGGRCGRGDLIRYLGVVGELDNWSEHWRGIDIQKIKFPPKDVLLMKIKDMEKSIEHYKERLCSYREMYSRFKG